MTNDVNEKVERFFEKYPIKRYAKGEVIIRAETDPPGVLFIVEGRVSQYDISPNGAITVVNVFKKAAFFPMSWAINKTPNHYFFEAATEVMVRQAPRADAVRFVQENPDVLFNLLARVYRGADGLLRRMAHLMGGDAQSRLQFELLNAAYRFGEDRPDGTIFVPLTETELAAQSGLTRETVNRSIQKLKGGMIEVTRRGFIVHDLAKIEEKLGEEL